MQLKRTLLPSIVLAALLTGCQTSSSPPPAESSLPRPQPTAEATLGSVRVKPATLNIRQSPSTDAAVISTARRGQKLELLGSEQDWKRVRLADGSVGWVASKHVVPVKAAAGCLPTRNFSFIRTPPLSFSDGGPRGTVTVEASVDATGKVTSTKVTANPTGDASLGQKAEAEIAAARFNPPVTDCRPRAFVYVYKRQF